MTGRRAARRRLAGHRSAREEGYLLLIALFVLVLTMAMGSAIAAAWTLRMERLERQQANLQLSALLDGAMARTLAELAEHPGWLGTGGEVPLGDGTYAVEAAWLGNSRVGVRLSASYGRSGRAAEAVVDTFTQRVVRWGPLPYDPLSRDGIPRPP